MLSPVPKTEINMYSMSWYQIDIVLIFGINLLSYLEAWMTIIVYLYSQGIHKP